MRIDLTGRDRKQRGRRKGSRRGNRRSWALDTAITMPQTRKGRRAGKQGASPHKDRTRPGRAGRGRRRDVPEAQASVRPSRSIPWWTLLLRFSGVLILAACIGVMAYVSADGRFFVYEAHVVGARHLAPEIIYQVAGVHEQNIFWIDPQEVAKRIVGLVGIQAVRVRCELPALVTIEVEEREPALMWRATSQVQDLWLDGEGIVLPYHGDVNSQDMIFVVDYGERHLKVGDRIEPEGMVASVLRLASTVPGVRVFYYQPERGLSFTQGVDGAEWPVYVGSSEDLARKIQVMQALTGYLQANSIRPRYVDVRWANHPVYGKPAGETTEGGN